MKSRRFVVWTASLSIFLAVLSACTFVAPSYPQGIFPRDFPRVPPPDASAVEVPAGYRVEIFMQDLNYPTSVEMDDSGNVYIAESGFVYGDPVAPGRILRISPDGSINTLVDRLDSTINDLLWHQGRLYISHFGKISTVDSNGEIHDLVTGLPASFGHQNNQMSVGPDGKIYFGMGVVTNSGIVGLDNAFPFVGLLLFPDMHDVPAHDVKLTGETFLTPQPNNVLARQGRLVDPSSNLNYAVTSLFNHDPDASMLVRTGAFQPFGHSDAEVVEGEVKASGTVLRMNPDGSKLEVYAWGLRNPFGVNWSPDGQLYATDNGYDDRGSRPVANAEDNIWLIRQDAWYGWPDYSSGIPLTDPRFQSTRGPELIFLMAEHPPVEMPFMTRPKHAALTKFDFSTSEQFGFQEELFIAEFGAGVPITGTEEVQVGQQVIRINPATRAVETFFRAKPEALGPEGAEYISTRGPRHPMEAFFSPDGTSLYIVDIGALDVHLAGAGPFPRPYPRTGVVWRVTREGTRAPAPPGNLSPVPPPVSN
jgi:glucose/arabinose dehydrogenase